MPGLSVASNWGGPILIGISLVKIEYPPYALPMPRG